MFYFYRYNFDSVFPIKVSFLLYLHKCSVYLIEGPLTNTQIGLLWLFNRWEHRKNYEAEMDSYIALNDIIFHGLFDKLLKRQTRHTVCPITPGVMFSPSIILWPPCDIMKKIWLDFFMLSALKLLDKYTFFQSANISFNLM